MRMPIGLSRRGSTTARRRRIGPALESTPNRSRSGCGVHHPARMTAFIRFGRCGRRWRFIRSGSPAIRQGGMQMASTAGRDAYDIEPAGYGWVVFAGVMLAIVGTLNFIYGIAAISDSKFYVRDTTFVI